MINHVILDGDEPYTVDFALTPRGDAQAKDFFHHKKIIITNGFLKKTPQLPISEISRAERLRSYWLAMQGDAR